MKVKSELTDLACEWSEDEDFWSSDCGELFQFDADGPEVNGFKFCPYCGKEMCEVRDD